MLVSKWKPLCLSSFYVLKDSLAGGNLVAECLTLIVSWSQFWCKPMYTSHEPNPDVCDMLAPCRR